MKDWEQGEKITANLFGFVLTSGSGRGHDKGDSKDADWRADTKTYHLPTKSYGVNHEKFVEWRRNASRLGQNFLLHIIPYSEDGQPLRGYDTVQLDARLFKNILKRLDELERIVVDCPHNH